MSRSYLDATRARMAALSGLEYAIACLLPDAMGGPAAGAPSPWVYGGGPLDTTVLPSYVAGTALGHAYSGTIGGTYAPFGDQFVLKLEDANAKLNVVGLAVEPGVLGIMLNNLGRGLALEQSGAPGRAGYDPIVGRGMAMASMSGTPGASRVRENLIRLLGRRDFSLLEDYLGFDGWIDPTTIKPNGRTRPNRPPAFARQPRPPINVNAASRPVLVSVLADLQTQRGGPISFGMAVDVADAILARRADPGPGGGPFRDWPDFYAFILGRVGRIPRFRELDAWAILANADPNFHPAWLNLERVIAPVLDKTDLRLRTTEFCFHDSGVYEITSLGRILAPDGRIQASAKVCVSVRVFDALRHTLQEEFERGRRSPAAENTGTWPQPMGVDGAAPAWWAGHVQLLTDRPTPLPVGAPPSFSALLRTGIPADFAVGSPVAVTDQESGEDVAVEGDQLLEGLLFSPDRGEFTRYATAGNVDAREGTVEFWVKFDDRRTEQPLTLYLSTCPETSEVGVQHRIRAALEEGTLRVESQRLCYVSGEYLPPRQRAAWPVPYLQEESTVACALPGADLPHEWHHVVASWEDGTRQTLVVDGRRGVAVSETPTSPTVVFTGWPPYDPLLVIAGDGAADLSPATLDDLRVYPSGSLPSALRLRRPRFEEAAPGRYAGRFEGAFDAGDRPRRLLGAHWTAWLPGSYGGIAFASPPGSVELELDTGSGPTPVPNRAGRGALEARGLGTLPAGSPLVYRLTFLQGSGRDAGTVTPIVDDVTILHAVDPPEFREFFWMLED
ncbi:MAG: hypothetical protein HYZ53_11200 [Planctomycetes bacterium]|nr:hypothetical protein [Planctomycetota bacterium]